MVGDDDETSSSAEESIQKQSQRKTRKNGKKDKKSKKEAKKGKKADKKAKKKVKKRKASSGSDSSSSSGRKNRKKKKDGKKAKGEVVQQAWIFNRTKAIRKEDASISKDDALNQAVADYCTVFEGGSSLPDAGASSSGPTKPDDEILAEFTDGPVADAVREAVRLACDKAREAGKSDEEIKTEATKARNSILTVATSAGLYDPTKAKVGQEQQTSLFLQSHEKKLVDYVKHGMPTTGNRSLEEVLDSWKPRELELEEGAAKRAKASLLGNKFVSDGTQTHSI